MQPPGELPGAFTVTSNQWLPFPIVLNKCGAVDVHVFGNKHIVIRDRRDTNDGVHLGFHMNFNLLGESATGVKYHYSGTQSSQTYLRYPSLADKTEYRVRMLAQGNAEDLIIRLTIHITVTPNGDIATEFGEAYEECGTGGSGGTPSP
ncbi:MAG: hypothetical protein HY704_13480 [Gemmatimonadetes bacterium]|nr:hypothetical protein [Gemmatimonadota bacterium]